jgi:NAD(P)-dependent dehydrogenase (short-subunit alcohol dehydrogenase family)
VNRALLLATLGVGGYLAYRALKPRYDFRGKHVLITGGSRGLGLVLARELASRGARLSICCRDPDELELARQDLSARAASVFGGICDVTDRGSIREFIAAARESNGPIDVLVNNAGIIQVGPLESMREVDFEQSLRTHFWAALYTSLEVIPEMKERRTGRIVNIASIGGKVAIPHLLPYTAGKFALVGFSHGLRAELLRWGIVVTTVNPGLMRTGSHINAEFKGRHDEEYAWFALGGSVPGFSMNAARAAREIIAACARGDADVVLGLLAKAAVLADAIFPDVTANLLALVNRTLLPEPGGIGTRNERGSRSRGLLPDFVTTLSDRAAKEDNEVVPSHKPPATPST